MIGLIVWEDEMELLKRETVFDLAGSHLGLSLKTTSALGVFLEGV